MHRGPASTGHAAARQPFLAAPVGGGVALQAPGIGLRRQSMSPPWCADCSRRLLFAVLPRFRRQPGCLQGEPEGRHIGGAVQRATADFLDAAYPVDQALLVYVAAARRSTRTCFPRERPAACVAVRSHWPRHSRGGRRGPDGTPARPRRGFWVARAPRRPVPRSDTTVAGNGCGPGPDALRARPRRNVRHDGAARSRPASCPGLPAVSRRGRPGAAE